eukprot:30745-Pelagococcus_subviridis.AAC.9
MSERETEKSSSRAHGTVVFHILRARRASSSSSRTVVARTKTKTKTKTSTSLHELQHLDAAGGVGREEHGLVPSPARRGHEQRLPRRLRRAARAAFAVAAAGGNGAWRSRGRLLPPNAGVAAAAAAAAAAAPLRLLREVVRQDRPIERLVVHVRLVRLAPARDELAGADGQPDEVLLVDVPLQRRRRRRRKNPITAPAPAPARGAALPSSASCRAVPRARRDVPLDVPHAQRAVRGRGHHLVAGG